MDIMDDGKLAAANLPDDVVVEILSRLPVRALHQCKLVSRAWRAVISHPDHRRRLAQPLLGFFYHLHVDASSPPIPYWRFAAAAGGVDPAVRWFQPPPGYSATDTELLDSCNGLVLLRCCRAPSSSVYVVCNPAAGDWVELPAPTHAPGAFGLRSDHLQGRRRTRLAALAFDPAVSPSRFHVLQLVEREEYDDPFMSHYCFVVEAAEIYSSETKAWHLSVVMWNGYFKCTGHQAAYHDGSVHFAVDDGGAVVSVDVEGGAWRLTSMIPVCQVTYGGGRFLGRSRGRLLYVHKGSHASLSVYSLERQSRGADEQWELKHYASPMDQFGKTLFKEHDAVVAVHPDGDVIFLFDACRGILMAYDMGRRTVRDIQLPLAQASRYYPFFPYVPMYSSQALSSGGN
ncbi:unnamed protein product [Urochloa decumbens]|uniref:F-box domain-containing protein n=1 Tax=Urochloa decumbens TaxID=240449 RepID=A0ABC9A588_9POAL